jgi:uncharacterized radical SAM superfamily Fe-S cluster-containing enzyme
MCHFHTGAAFYLFILKQYLKLYKLLSVVEFNIFLDLIFLKKKKIDKLLIK